VSLRSAAEKGYRVGVMEYGKRWNDEDIPKTNWHDGRLHSRPGSGTAPSVHIPVVEEFADRLAKKMGTRQEALAFEVLNRTASAHFIGGIPICDTSGSGAVDPYQRVFGQPGLHVMEQHGIGQVAARIVARHGSGCRC
jgi:hypothetical protein